MTIVSTCVAVLERPSVTWTVKLLDPVPVGVPLIIPPELSDKPAGKLPEDNDHEYEPLPPLALSATL